MNTCIYIYDLYYRLLNNIFKWVIFLLGGQFLLLAGHSPVKMLFHALNYSFIVE